MFLILFFIFPLSYKAPVSILPPTEDDQFSGLGSLLGGGGDFSSLLTGSAFQGNSQLFVEILKSRSAAEYVVSKHNLQKFFDEENLYKAAGKLSNQLDIDLSKEGIITLAVEVKTSVFPMFFADKDSIRNLSAALSNTYVEALDKINRDKLSTKAKRARLYIEEQLLQTKSALDSAETALMEFQRLNKTISLPEQVQVAIESAAKIKSEIVKTEIELGLLKTNLREDNSKIIALQRKLNELKQQYNKMEMGSQDYLLAFEDVPELGRELASLLREVKIQNEVYLLLQQQYYKEKIQENRDLPTVEVLDPAIVPFSAVGPRLIYTSVLTGTIVFFLTVTFLIMREKRTIRSREKLKSQE